MVSFVILSLSFCVRFYGKKNTWCRLHTITLKWPTRQRMSFIWQHRFTFTCIGVDRTNGGGKNSVYFPNPSHEAFRVPRCRRQFNVCCSPRPMSKVVYGLMMLLGLDFGFGRGGQVYWAPPQLSDRGQGATRSEWAMARGRKFNCMLCHLRRRKEKSKSTKMWMWEWSCDGLNVVSVALNSTSWMFSLLFLT